MYFPLHVIMCVHFQGFVCAHVITPRVRHFSAVYYVLLVLSNVQLYHTPLFEVHPLLVALVNVFDQSLILVFGEDS